MPILPNAKKSRANTQYDQIDDLPKENVSPDVYKYYMKALGASPVTVALLFYFSYQVSCLYNFTWILLEQTRSLLDNAHN